MYSEAFFTNYLHAKYNLVYLAFFARFFPGPTLWSLGLKICPLGPKFVTSRDCSELKTTGNLWKETTFSATADGPILCR